MVQLLKAFLHKPLHENKKIQSCPLLMDMSDHFTSFEQRLVIMGLAIVLCSP